MWGDCVTPAGIPTIGCIGPLFSIGLTWAITLISVVSLFMIIFAGIKYITSGGGKGVEEAKNILTYAIIGFLVVLFAYFIVSIISTLTGARCILTFGFTSCR